MRDFINETLIDLSWLSFFRQNDRQRCLQGKNSVAAFV
jgi:hypothetical protein